MWHAIFFSYANECWYCQTRSIFKCCLREIERGYEIENCFVFVSFCWLYQVCISIQGVIEIQSTFNFQVLSITKSNISVCDLRSECVPMNSYRFISKYINCFFFVYSRGRAIDVHKTIFGNYWKVLYET